MFVTLSSWAIKTRSVHFLRTPYAHEEYHSVQTVLCKGCLKMDDGAVFKPNDRYPLTKDLFRLYYTSFSTDRQTIDIYVEDRFGQMKQTFIYDGNRND